MDNCELGEILKGQALVTKRTEFLIALGLVRSVKEAIRESFETENRYWGEEGQNV